jgi:hypothetical protein
VTASGSNVARVRRQAAGGRQQLVRAPGPLLVPQLVDWAEANIDGVTRSASVCAGI